MCAQVAPSAEYLRGHGRVAVDVTALRRLWQHSPVLGLVALACVPVCVVLRGSLLCNSCGLSAVKINENYYYYYYYFAYTAAVSRQSLLQCVLTFSLKLSLKMPCRAPML